MNFGLTKKFSAIDFEEVSLSDLVLIGGGCGGGGGGGGSTSVQSVQQAAQTAAQQPGANLSASVTVSTPSVGGGATLQWGYNSQTGLTVSGTANVNASTGGVTATASGSTGGGFWASVGNFFSWLFGSH